MVPTARTAARPAQLRYLNQPQPVEVCLDPRGWPCAVVQGRGLQPVLKIRDRWRVDDGWWREPLCRMYFELELADGQVVTLYHDRIGNAWYQQRYG